MAAAFYWCKPNFEVYLNQFLWIRTTLIRWMLTAILINLFVYLLMNKLENNPPQGKEQRRCGRLFTVKGVLPLGVLLVDVWCLHLRQLDVVMASG